MKKNFRKRILTLRDQLSEDARAANSMAITERLLKMPEYQQAATVLGYMNFGTEFASELWVARVLAEGKRLALPKVNRQTNQLELYWVSNLKIQLKTGMWGIREPIVELCERLDKLTEIEFVLLPGVAFSRDGARLGYGRGFYDKLLARLDAERRVGHHPALVVGAFSVQLAVGVPQEDTDRKVQWLVTENETIHCEG